MFLLLIVLYYIIATSLSFIYSHLLSKTGMKYPIMFSGLTSLWQVVLSAFLIYCREKWLKKKEEKQNNSTLVYKQPFALNKVDLLKNSQEKDTNLRIENSKKYMSQIKFDKSGIENEKMIVFEERQEVRQIDHGRVNKNTQDLNINSEECLQSYKSVDSKDHLEMILSEKPYENTGNTIKGHEQEDFSEKKIKKYEKESGNIEEFNEKVVKDENIAESLVKRRIIDEKLKLQWFHLLPCTITGMLDIILSTLSLQSVSLALYTMIKSSSPIFILLSSFLINNEPVSFKSFFIIVVIGIGTFFLTYKKCNNYDGFALLTLISTAVSGIRWSFIQKYLRKEKSFLHFIRRVNFGIAIKLIIYSLLFEMKYEGQTPTKINTSNEISHNESNVFVPSATQVPQSEPADTPFSFQDIGENKISNQEIDTLKGMLDEPEKVYDLSENKENSSVKIILQSKAGDLHPKKDTGIENVDKALSVNERKPPKLLSTEPNQIFNFTQQGDNLDLISGDLNAKLTAGNDFGGKTKSTGTFFIFKNDNQRSVNLTPNDISKDEKPTNNDLISSVIPKSGDLTLDLSKRKEYFPDERVHSQKNDDVFEKKQSKTILENNNQIKNAFDPVLTSQPTQEKSNFSVEKLDSATDTEQNNRFRSKKLLKSDLSEEKGEAVLNSKIDPESKSMLQEVLFDTEKLSSEQRDTTFKGEERPGKNQIPEIQTKNDQTSAYFDKKTQSSRNNNQDNNTKDITSAGNTNQKPKTFLIVKNKNQHVTPTSTFPDSTHIKRIVSGSNSSDLNTFLSDFFTENNIGRQFLVVTEKRPRENHSRVISSFFVNKNAQNLHSDDKISDDDLLTQTNSFLYDNIFNLGSTFGNNLKSSVNNTINTTKSNFINIFNHFINNPQSCVLFLYHTVLPFLLLTITLSTVSFLLILVEFSILKSHSSVFLSILGILKELTIIILSTCFFELKLDGTNWAGLGVSLVGLVLYALSKRSK